MIVLQGNPIVPDYSKAIQTQKDKAAFNQSMAEFWKNLSKGKMPKSIKDKYKQNANYSMQVSNIAMQNAGLSPQQIQQSGFIPSPVNMISPKMPYAPTGNYPVIQNSGVGDFLSSLSFEKILPYAAMGGAAILLIIALNKRARG